MQLRKATVISAIERLVGTWAEQRLVSEPCMPTVPGQRDFFQA
jgi:hypothetical protein